ncbi:hypothetical protein MKW92_027302 [Papaver armeniacum]|nr:hypothetical protein MKW92_027302 [Papaver armeniacum]
METPHDTTSGRGEIGRKTKGHCSYIPNTRYMTQNGGDISSMPGFWLIPQLTVMGLTEAFNSTAQIEFYYKQFPEKMRSIGMSTYILGMSVGNYLCGFLVSIVHRTTEIRLFLLHDDSSTTCEYVVFLSMF